MGEQDGKDGLSSLRQQIRELDDQLMVLAAKRLAVAKAVGEYKLKHNLPVKDYKVEKDVVARSAQRAAELGVYRELAEALSKLMIRYSVMAQDEDHVASRRHKATSVRRILIAGGRGHMGLWLSEFFDSFGHEVSHFDSAGAPSGGGDDDGYPLVSDLEAAARDHDVVILATPISATGGLIDRIAASGTRALVFDICSLKTPLLPAIRRAAAKGLRITSVHPMFGPKVELLAGRNIILCQVADAEATAAARALFADTTASLVELPLERHDELMGYVLGLSHLTSLVFAGVLARSGLPFAELRSVASTTFNAQLEVSRPVAFENRDLYFEIQAENSFTPKLVAALQKELQAYSDAIAGDDRGAFVQRMGESRDYLAEGEEP